MIIIVEGCDKNGKTTLSEYILNKPDYKFGYVHFTSPKAVHRPGDIVLTPGISVFNQLNNYMHKFIEYKNEYEDTNLLCDRFYWSDIVYGPLYRKDCEVFIGQYEKLYLDALMEPLNTVVIHCQTKSFEVNWKLIEEENEGVLNRELLKDTREKYNKVFNETTLPVHKYSFDKMDLSDFVSNLISKYDSPTSEKTFINDLFVKTKGFGKFIGSTSFILEPTWYNNIYSIPGDPSEAITFDEFISFCNTNNIVPNGSWAMIRANSAIDKVLKFHSKMNWYLA